MSTPSYTLAEGVRASLADERMLVYLPGAARGFAVMGVALEVVGHMLRAGPGASWSAATVADLGIPPRTAERIVDELVGRCFLEHAGAPDDAAPSELPVTRRLVVASDGDIPSPLGGLRPVVADLWQPTVELRNGDLVVVQAHAANARLVWEWNRRAVRASAHFLPVRYTESGFEVGPLAIPGFTACFECYWWRMEAHYGRDRSASLRLLDEQRWAPGDLPSASADIARLVSAITDCEVGRAARPDHALAPMTLDTVLAVNVVTYSTRLHAVLRTRACGSCGA